MFTKPNHQTLGVVCAVSLALFAACSDDGSSSDAVDSAGTGASGAGASAAGGKSGSMAAGTSGAAGATAGRGMPAAGRGMPAAGSGVAGAAGGGGRGGAGGAGSGSGTDDDAGISPGAGSGGSSGSAGSSGAGGGAGAAAGSGGSGAAAATFTEVYAIFTTSCMGSNCHVGATRPGDMLSFADKPTAYMNLVGVNAVSCAGEKRVVAGDPAKSELVHALARTMVGNCTNTPRMPDNKPMLPASDIEKVRSWVQAGAKND